MEKTTDCPWGSPAFPDSFGIRSAHIRPSPGLGCSSERGKQKTNLKQRALGPPWKPCKNSRRSRRALHDMAVAPASDSFNDRARVNLEAKPTVPRQRACVATSALHQATLSCSFRLTAADSIPCAVPPETADARSATPTWFTSSLIDPARKARLSHEDVLVLLGSFRSRGDS